MSIRYETTQFGFNWGAAVIERIHSDEKKGCVALTIATKKTRLSIYVTKTGKIRINNQKTGKELKEV